MAFCFVRLCRERLEQWLEPDLSGAHEDRFVDAWVKGLALPRRGRVRVRRFRRHGWCLGYGRGPNSTEFRSREMSDVTVGLGRGYF